MDSYRVEKHAAMQIQLTDEDAEIEPVPTDGGGRTAYKNAKQHSDKQNPRIEHDKALGRVIIELMKDDTELFKKFSDNDDHQHSHSRSRKRSRTAR